MASSLPKPTSVKKLNELLMEQQEPFSLHVYLLERGCSLKRLNSKGIIEFFPAKSNKDLKVLGGSHGLKRKNTILHCSKILKSVLEKIVFAKRKPGMSDCDSKAIQDRVVNVAKSGGSTQHVAELDHFSKRRSLRRPAETKFHSPEQRDASPVCELRNSRDQEIDIDGTHKWAIIEDSKQSSPVSVLDEQPTDALSSFHSQVRFSSRSISNQNKKVTDDLIFSKSLWELLIHSLLENQGSVGVTGLKDLLGTRRVLEQTKQLLFDCVREVLETLRRDRRKQRVHELLGAEEVGKIMCDRIFRWGNLSGNVTNITELIHSDFLEAKEERNDFRLETREIGVEIGDAIFEDIRDEIVRDVTDSFVVQIC